jgi:hypothetical protein
MSASGCYGTTQETLSWKIVERQVAEPRYEEAALRCMRLAMNWYAKSGITEDPRHDSWRLLR